MIFEREVNVLKRLPEVLPCRRRLIITNNESSTITDAYGTIEVIPSWKWILE